MEIIKKRIETFLLLGGVLSGALLFIIGLFDPVFSSNETINLLFFYAHNSTLELLIILCVTIFLFRRRLATKNKYFRKALERLEATLQKANQFKQKTYLNKYSIKSLLLVTIIFIAAINFGSLEWAISLINTKYTKTLPRNYRIEEINRAISLEDDGNNEMAIRKYKLIEEKYPQLAEISEISKRKKKLENLNKLSSKLLSYSREKTNTQVKVFYLLYAKMLNQNNSIIDQEIEKMIVTLESSKLNSSFLFDTSVPLNYIRHDPGSMEFEEILLEETRQETLSLLKNFRRTDELR